MPRLRPLATPSHPAIRAEVPDVEVSFAAWNGRERDLELIGRADRALYRAKAAGGARLERAPEEDTVAVTGP